MLVILTFLSLAARAQDPAPAKEIFDGAKQWIWAGEAQAYESVWFRRTFEIPGELEGTVREAWLEASCDNRMVAWLNGREVFEVEDWERPRRAGVEQLLRQGLNVLAVWGQNDGGPAGLQLVLEIEREDGMRERIETGADWLATREEPAEGWLRPEFDDAHWPSAYEIAESELPRQWAKLQPATEPDRSGVVSAAELELPPGFEAELLYAVPRARQGSWVAATFDPRGRLIVSDQHGGLFRVTLPHSEGEDVGVEPLGVDLGEAHGLVCAFGALYVVVSHAARYEDGLYRVRDRDGDDRYDTIEKLAAFEAGSGEHGPHAVRVGPDGRSLYVIAGNHTALPEPISVSRVTPAWGEDQLLGRREDPRGHAVGYEAPGGWLARTDPDGRTWELVAAGMRNAYDFDFDAEGEPFTFDSDMEWDLGLPWYRPTRICHLVSGADFGWRRGSGKWPVGWPDTLPSALDMGLGSPTGVEFGARSSFPEPWRSSFFAADWAYGRIHAVQLEPRGASFGGSSRVFVRGRAFPVTDLAFGPDGAMYVTTGGRRTRSALYRIRWVGGGTGEPARESPADAFAAREKRRSLETWHARRDPAAVDALWPELASEDRFLRHAARVALEHQDPSVWIERALAETEPRAAIEALLALARLAPPELRERALVAWERLPVERLATAERIGALRVLGLIFIRMGGPLGGEGPRLAERLGPLFPSGDEELDRELARVLARLDDPCLVAKALERIEGAPTLDFAVHLAFCLRDVRSGWSLDARRRFLAWLDGISSRLHGGASFAKYLDGLRGDLVAGLDEGERAALGSLLEPPPRPTTEPPPLSKLVRPWTVADLEPRLDRLAHGRSLERGREAFSRARCLECHRFAGDGGASGPDLTGAGARFSPRDLLEATVDPSAAISDPYQDTEVLTEARLYVGRIESDDGERLVLRTAPPVEERIELARAEILLQRRHPLSRMPEGLVDVLTEEEILDLFAFLLGKL
ncbi:MAG TPA: c-type cytochrome [Planctomycetota bacterium]|nr:c-type cytochrome [Planctomycetota bacterium]